MKSVKKETLIKASKDLYYEVTHLIGLFLYLNQKENNDIKRHTFLESLLIHARNVYCFLYNEYNKNQKDDVLALYYIKNVDEWITFKKTQIPKDVFIDFTKRINKEIAHLSFTRTQKTEQDKWDISFVIDLVEGVDKFLNMTPSSLLDKDWENYQSVKDQIYLNKENFLFSKWVYSTH